ncbi:hypothetical protein Krac_6863 [Ktedonobacter racemifer DSM 44963]|uniref:Uncharacterized protein n=1 Tax=Ktedonobacter racemifer DSM 44963 TaxID=485913 RepID=D6TPM2_KTERA|nr:hypothetical protein Krac_6863 [Ktedonobacter racemifer DSM 44963]
MTSRRITSASLNTAFCGSFVQLRMLSGLIIKSADEPLGREQS